MAYHVTGLVGAVSQHQSPPRTVREQAIVSPLAATARRPWAHPQLRKVGRCSGEATEQSIWVLMALDPR